MDSKEYENSWKKKMSNEHDKGMLRLLKTMKFILDESGKDDMGALESEAFDCLHQLWERENTKHLRPACELSHEQQMCN